MWALGLEANPRGVSYGGKVGREARVQRDWTVV